MAIRVRKLARKVGRNPVELLGVLKALGYDRFKSPEDMLSAPVEKKLRSALNEGVKPLLVQPERVRKAAPQTLVSPAPDLFAGVVRQKVDERYTKAGAEAPKPRARPMATPSPVAPPESAPVTPAVDLALEQRALDAQKAVVAAERRALEAEAAALEAEKLAWKKRRELQPDGVSLASVFQARGLLGDDEAQRALRALVEVRRIPELLPFLQVHDAVGLETWLRSVLTLVDGPPPEALAREALVSVAAERADIPGAAGWRKMMGRLSEQLMLRGARRVSICGGDSRAHRLLRSGFDPRIDVRVRPSTRFTLSDLRALQSESDAAVLWNLEVPPEVAEALPDAAIHVARVERRGVAEFVADWTRALAG